MKLTNWLKAGRQSKKEDNVIANIHCNPAGSMGESKWNDYVQITFYSKERESFVRWNMTKEEAINFNQKLTDGLKKFTS
jgi:hypothetical protein